MARGWRYLVRNEVIVNLDTGSTFKGVMYDVRGSLLILKQAALLTPNNETPVDGDLCIDKGRVEFMQMLTGAR